MRATFRFSSLPSSKMYRFVAFALVAAVSCNDLIQGPEVGRQIYNDTKEASPAIWKQMDEVTIKANDTDVISRIVVTDLRPNKDGEAKIVEGGKGQKNVTVQLKSPTILRGYDFHIEVYVVNENEKEIDFSEDISTTEVPMFTEQTPEMENDTEVNPLGQDTSSSSSTEVSQDKVEAPIITDRKTRNTDVKVDPIVQYVRDNVTATDSQVSHPSNFKHTSEGTTMATPADDTNVSVHPHQVQKDEEFKKGQ